MAEAHANICNPLMQEAVQIAPSHCHISSLKKFFVLMLISLGLGCVTMRAFSLYQQQEVYPTMALSMQPLQQLKSFSKTTKSVRAWKRTQPLSLRNFKPDRSLKSVQVAQALNMPGVSTVPVVARSTRKENGDIMPFFGVALYPRIIGKGRSGDGRENVVMSSGAKDVANSTLGFVNDRVPGLLICGIIGAASEFTARCIPVALSPLLYATAFGIAIGNLLRTKDPELKMMSGAATGMQFAKQRLLRAGIILYGAKITFGAILCIGWPGILTVLYSVSTTLLLGFGLGKALGLSEGLVTLVSTGSAICGCSAVAATQPIINAEPHEVAAAVGVVVLCGTCAMFLYPALFATVPTLASSPQLMGIYTGSTVHELAGVVAAGKAMGAEVASTSIVTKLLRVFMLEPWIIALFYLGIGQAKSKVNVATAGSGAKKGKGVPWFAFGFLAVATVNSIWGFAPKLQSFFSIASASFLATAMAALGLDTDLVKVRSLGWRPIVLAMMLWANLLGMGFLVARFLVSAF